MSKISQYPQISSVAGDDLLVVVDVDDTSEAGSGTTKSMLVSQLPGAVSSVFGRAGAVAAESGDYTAAEVGAVATSAVGAASGVAGLDSSARLPIANLPNVLRSDYKFSPDSYGGVPDVMAVPDGAMTASSAVLACTTSTPFGSSSVGKFAYVAGAGAGGAGLYAEITGYADSGHVTLSVAASTTVTGAGVAFGTDNAGPIQTARADAYAFCAGSPREAALFFGGPAYAVASAPVLGGSTLGNQVVPLPPVAVAGRKLRLRLAGDADAAPLVHWQQQVPQVNGPAVVVLSAPVAVDPVYGPPSVFGGPYDGYGAAESLFSNMQVVVDGVSIATPWDSGYIGFDFLGLAEAVVVSGSKIAMATVGGGHGWPDITQYGNLTRTSCGLRMPDVNNNDRCDILWWSTEGDVYGFMPSEHTNWQSARAVYCFVGCQAYGGSPWPHAARGRHLSAEDCNYCVGVMPGGVTGFVGGYPVKLTIAEVDNEGSTLLNDPSDLMSGSIGVTGNYTPGFGQIVFSGGANVKVYDLMQVPGLVASPQAVPASGTALVNQYYRNASVNVQPNGATISAIKRSGTTLTGVTSGEVRVPTNQGITLVYSGGTPSWQWDLD